MKRLHFTTLTVTVLSSAAVFFACSDDPAATVPEAAVEAGSDASVEETPDTSLTDGGSFGVPPVAVDDYCAALTAALTAREVRCGLLDPANAPLYEQSVSPSCAANVALAKSALYTYRPEVAGACIAVLKARGCNLLGRLPEACRGVFSPVANGGPGTLCEDTFFGESSTCAAGLACGAPLKADAGTTCDTCQTPLNKAAGAACTSYAECAPSGYCNGSKCVAYRTAGQSCTPASTAQICIPTTYCKPTGGGNGTCTIRPKLGGACAVNGNDCAEGYCASADGGSSGTCAALLPDGQTCQRASNCSSGICNSLKKCGFVPQGETCAHVDECGPNASCRLTLVDGGAKTACEAPREPAALGQPCDTHEDCNEALFCAGATKNAMGSCLARFAVGKECYENVECANGLYCRGGSAGLFAGNCAPLVNLNEACDGADQADCKLFSSCKKPDGGPVGRCQPAPQKPFPPGCPQGGF